MTDAELEAWARRWADSPVAQERILGWAILALLADLNAMEEAKNQVVRENLGLEKANALLNAGMESACEDRDRLKQRVRQLEAVGAQPG